MYIAYRRAEMMEIIAILHGQRDVKRLLNSRM
jgi:plasmid stabilization system protein ParE